MEETLRVLKLMEKKLEDLKKIVAKKEPGAFNPDSYSGSGFDDGWFLGFDQGERSLAQDIRKLMGW